MGHKILVVLDDTGNRSDIITDIIGNKGFGDVIVKRRPLASHFSERLRRSFPDFSMVHVRSFFEFNDVLKTVEEDDERTRILHFFSRHIISDPEKASLSLKKLAFVEKPFRAVSRGKTAAALFKDPESYADFLRAALSCSGTDEACARIKGSFDVEGLTDIGTVGNFIQCVTGSFDARYFNSLSGDNYTLVKQSSNKTKIKAEYTFYHLLPDDMKFWFVMPFNYRETDENASYTMERIHMTDLAVKFVHGSIDAAEFAAVLDKYFYFFKSRHAKPVPRAEYERIAKSLYEDKVRARLEDLKALPAFQRIAELMKAGCACGNVDALFDRYRSLKMKVESRNSYPSVSVIGHGDPCFANVLYNKSTQTLKFIDPKGALKEEELWTNPYYDVAKLSHSVCGRYDFFNNALFDISINEDFRAELNIGFDNAAHKELFRKKLAESGFDYLTVRVYEASLFISMLPLHIDCPHKVFGFILNAMQILEEIENEI